MVGIESSHQQLSNHQQPQAHQSQSIKNSHYAPSVTAEKPSTIVDSLPLKKESITIELEHSFGPDTEFVKRGSILVRPKTDIRSAQALFVSHRDLSDREVEQLTNSAAKGELYLLRAKLKNKDGTFSKVTQTLVKSCSLLGSNLQDTITVNLSPLNDFISVNIHTTDSECELDTQAEIPRKFNTTLVVDSGEVGPVPDTASYIRRLEEERQHKLREGKEENKSFFAKYWMYIVPAMVILMMFSGPDQGGR